MILFIALYDSIIAFTCVSGKFLFREFEGYCNLDSGQNRQKKTVSRSAFFVNSALKIQFHIVKNTLLQTAYFAHWEVSVLFVFWAGLWNVLELASNCRFISLAEWYDVFYKNWWIPFTLSDFVREDTMCFGIKKHDQICCCGVEEIWSLNCFVLIMDTFLSL